MEKIKKIKFYNYYGGFGLINEHPNYEIILTPKKLSYQKIYERKAFEEKYKDNSLIWSAKLEEGIFDEICDLLPSLFRNADIMVCDGDGLVVTMTLVNNKTVEEHVSLTLLDNNAQELNNIFLALLDGVELPYFVTNKK